MKKEIEIKTNVENISKIIKKIADIEEIKAVYLFGSATTGKMHLNSDIDICIFLDKENDDAETKAMYFSSDNLDISLFDNLPLAIKFRVFREGKPIVIKDSAFIRMKMQETIRQYLDFQDSLHRMCSEKIKCMI